MSQFVDECQLNVKAGDGGAGCVSFRREGPEAMGGPNGGDGGKGGDVWLVADHNVASLLAFRDHPHRKADNGVHGKGKDMHGRRGEALDVKVPIGTVVADLYSGEPAGAADAVTPSSCRTSGGRRASPSRASTARNAGSSSSCG
jgi:GTP-binding protein